MAASRPGSSGALITWLVIMAILFVTATIFAFIFQADARKSADSLETFKKSYKEIIENSELAGQDVTDLKEARSDARLGLGPASPVMSVAIEQRKLLAKTITGNPVSASAAKDQADRALQDAAARLKAAAISEPIPADNLVLAVGEVVKIAENRQGQVTSLQKDLAAEKEGTLAAIKRADDQAAAHEQAMAAVREETKTQIETATSSADTATSSVAEIEKAVSAERDKQTAAYNQIVTERADRDKTIGDKDKAIGVLQQKLSALRVDTTNTVVRQSDGEIIRLPGNNIVYVNLGAGDQITPGLTFEVYEKADGVPGIRTSDDTTLPQGKASIEITRVGANSSEARVVKVRPGYQLTEGDLIANLVYDRNTKYNFVVFGNFDLDQNGVAVPGDADIMKRLVTQWGAKVMPDVTVDTDFVVLGKEPAVPEFSAEQLQDPETRDRQQKAQAELESYNTVKDKAKELHIPILNQNRFLYFTGYFDSARR